MKSKFTTETELVENIVFAFDSLPKHESGKRTFYNNLDVSDSKMDHNQGIAIYDQFTLISVNESEEKYGSIFIFDNNTKKVISKYKVELEGMNHPSGMQSIGDYLVLGLQSKDYKQNRVAFFDLTGLKSNSQIKPISLSLNTLTQSASAVGITTVKGEKGSDDYHFVLAVSGDGSTTIYISSQTKIGLEDPGLKFNTGNVVLEKGFQGVQLLTQEDGKVFMIAFDSEGTATYDDFFFLYELQGNYISGEDLEMIQERKIHVVTSGNLGLLNPHCRYGTGVTIKDGAISCYVTGRTPVNELFNKVHFPDVSYFFGKEEA
jgi:hypothetical protein